MAGHGSRMMEPTLNETSGSPDTPAVIGTLKCVVEKYYPVLNSGTQTSRPTQVGQEDVVIIEPAILDVILKRAARDGDL